MFSGSDFINTEMVAGVNRAFSAGGISSSAESWALPQVRHGESVLWRTSNETAPSALRRKLQ